MTSILLLTFSMWVRPTGGAGHQTTDTALAARIERLFHTIFTTEDDAIEAAARSEVNEIYTQGGLPTVTEVGDEAAYEFVVLLEGQKLPPEFRPQIASRIKEAAARHETPSDAATFYEARLRIENTKREAETHAPTNPALRDEIARMFKIDQAVRQQQGFDRRKMEEADKGNAVPLQATLDKYGVPTYSMVGPEAANEFVDMVQHQPARFREEILPKLKANVDGGQADPESYALVYDRSQRDLGKKQFYGQQLECKAGEKLHEAPMEDEGHVNQRRAQLGLIRVELYARITAETMPQFCPPAQNH
jgi:hypothetical protein